MTLSVKQIEKLLKDHNTMKLMDTMDDMRNDIRFKNREIEDLEMAKLEIELKIRRKHNINPIDMMHFSIARVEVFRKQRRKK